MADEVVQAQGVDFEVESPDSPGVWTHIYGIRSFDGLDGAATVIDTTTLDSTAKESRQGLQDHGSWNLECFYLPNDPGQSILRQAKNNQQNVRFRVTYTGDSPLTRESCTVAVTTGTRSGGVDAVIETSFSLKIDGDITVELV